MLTITLYKYNTQSLKSLQNLSINPIYSAWKTITSAWCTICLMEPRFFILIAIKFLKIVIFFISNISYLLWEMFNIYLIKTNNVNIHKYLNTFYVRPVLTSFDKFIYQI